MAASSSVANITTALRSRQGPAVQPPFMSYSPTYLASHRRKITPPPDSGCGRKTKEGGLLDMSEKRELEILSRRKIFSILGLATLSLALPSTTLMVSRAEAQAPSTTPQAPSTTPTTAAPQTGRQQRRLARRQARTERRQARRQARTERRQTRRQARLQRRQTRRGTNPATPQ
jgi:hypothetical protein